MTKEELYAEELSSLIRCETVSETGVENGEKFTGFHELLRKVYPGVHEVCSVEKFGYSLLFRWKGKHDGSPVCLMSHHDVVEAGDNWTYPPFSGEIADGKIWGRGTLDTKGSLWAILRAAEELISEGFIPSHDVYIESACTEETDGSGADRISSELEKRGIRFSMVLDEGGMVMHDPLGGCDADFAMIGIAEKACSDLRFVARSSGGHASNPPKDTPLVRLGKFMAEADRAECFDVSLSDPVIEMFRAFAPYSHGIMKFIYKNAGALKCLLCRILPKLSPSSASTLRTTIAFTQAGGSEGTNVLPQEAFVTGNMRSSHHQGQENSIAAISSLAEKYDIEVEPVDIGYISGVTSTSSAGYRLITAALKEVFPDAVPAPYILTGASDCRYFDRVCDCCLRFVPFKINDQQLASIHGVDENLDVSNLTRAVDFYKYIMRRTGLDCTEN